MSRDIIKTLSNLIHLDQDAIRAYDEAINASENLEIRAKLTEFRGDHHRHVRDLEAQVRSLGAEPEAGRDVKGFLIEGFTALTSQGDKSALFAMRVNEELTNRTYRDALDDVLPEDIRVVVERNYEDEVRHISWIKEAISAGGWGSEKAA